jgi:hypothetical protein
MKIDYGVLIGKKTAFELNDELVRAQGDYIEYLKKENARLERMVTIQETHIVDIEQVRLRLYSDLNDLRLAVAAAPMFVAPPWPYGRF